jgi:molybdopterin converting factor small subunit
MAIVRLRGPLKDRTGSREHALNGATVAELLGELERAYPSVDGWILDERRHIRRHINVFVNGEQAGEETKLGDDDRVDILPAISGG